MRGGRHLLIALLLSGCSEVILDCDDPEAAGWSEENADAERDMLVAVNSARESGATCRGTVMPPVPPLEMDDALRCAARSHAVDMATSDYFAHDSLAGNGPSVRVDRVGYEWSVVSENIAAGRDTAEATVAGLLASTTGHCENMLDPEVVDAGMGVAFAAETSYGWYWTQVFAAPR